MDPEQNADDAINDYDHARDRQDDHEADCPFAQRDEQRHCDECQLLDNNMLDARERMKNYIRHLKPRSSDH